MKSAEKRSDSLCLACPSLENAPGKGRGQPRFSTADPNLDPNLASFALFVFFYSEILVYWLKI